MNYKNYIDTIKCSLDELLELVNVKEVQDFLNKYNAISETGSNITISSMQDTTKSTIKQMLMLLAVVAKKDLKDIYERLDFIDCVLDEDNYFFETPYRPSRDISIASMFHTNLEFIHTYYYTLWTTKVEQLPDTKSKELVNKIFTTWADYLELDKNNKYYATLINEININDEDKLMNAASAMSTSEFNAMEYEYIDSFYPPFYLYD